MSVCERCGKGVAQYCNHCMTDMHAEVLRLEDAAALPAGVYVSDGQGKVEAVEPVAAYDGWAHVGCPDCGRVTTVPLDRMEPTPWCVHNGNISWRDPHPDTQKRKRPAPWTRTVPVIVAALSARDNEGSA